MMHHPVTAAALLVMTVLVCSMMMMTCHAFAPMLTVRDHTSDTALEMGGFLDGKYDKSDIMKKEDDAMWIDDEPTAGGKKKEGWNPFKIAQSFEQPAKKKAAPAAKKAPPPPPAKKQPGFKFPWDK
jgi:hypothetical protein